MHSDPLNPQSDIASDNIERLLREAYQPEEPAPEFVERMGKLLQVAAAQRAAGPARVLRLRRRLAWGMAAAAAVAMMVLSAYALRPSLREQYADSRTASAAGSGEVTFSARTSEPAVAPLGLTAQPRTPHPATPSLAVGAELATRAGERRRVTLPDGSVLYVNQNTVAKVETDRRVALSSGEVFVEVAPRREERFVIHVAGREVAALGTKFAVRADHDGPRVFVTQGKVQVEGTRDLLHAGEQLVLATGHVSAAPRATHVLDWTRDLMIAAESPLVPASKHQGGALLAVDPNGQEAKLSLRKYHVDVHIEDGFARTTIDQTYFNHETWRLEGTFYFPLPPDASLSHLAMYVDGVLMQGGMCERDHARQVFETILHTRRDPALLEWVDGSTFKMRVFPLEGRQEKRILLSYTQRLESLYGQTKYRFPAGHNLEAVGAWSFHARIKRGGDLEWKCDSHTLQAAQQDGDLILTAQQQHVKLDRDITLRLHDAPASGDLRFSSADHDGSRYLMVRYRPKLTAAVTKQRRDWVFLFESGGNRDPLLARTQIDVIRTLLNNAEYDDTFAVVTAGTRSQAFASGAVPASPANVRQAVQWLEHTHLIGALDLGKALAATEPFLKAAKNPHLVHIGGGVPALGERREEVLAKSVAENVRYVGVGVGKRWSRSFMKLAAERTGGFFTQINPDEPVAWRALDLLATLNTPRLLDVKVLDDAEKVSFHSYTTLLADGEELCAIARVGSTLDPLPKSVSITGRLDGKPFAKTAAVRNVAEKADYLPRTWAKLEIDKLLAADAQANKAKLIELSKAMYVMTPFTSLLVLENDAMYTQYKVDRGRKDHWALYKSPQKIPIVYEPLAATPVPATTTPGQKPTPEEVLSTVVVRIPPRFLQYPSRPDPYGGHIAVTALQLYQGAFAVPAPGTFRGSGALDSYELLVESANPLQVFRLDTEASFKERVRLAGRPEAVLQSLEMPPVRTLDLSTRSRFGSGQGGAGDWSSPNHFMGYPHFANQGWGRWEVSDVNRPVGFGGGLGGFGGGMSGFGGGGFGSPGGSFGLPQLQTRGEPVSFRQRVPRGTTALLGNGALTATDDKLGILSGNDPFLVEETLKALQAEREIGFNGRLTRNTPWSGLELEALTQQRAKYYLGLDGADVAKKGKKQAYSEFGDRLEDLRAHLASGQRWPSLLYERPSFTGDGHVFSDLPSYAPGMNTTWADILAVLEAEARLPQASTGTIDPAAKALLDRSRTAGWQSVQVGGLVLTFDGSGRYAYEHKLPVGLREQVVCDGTTLLHLYPELGLGARRHVSRFHRSWLYSLIPWTLPPVEDLARTADVTLTDVATVVLTPRGAATAKDKYGKALSYGATHFVFAADGRLAERRVVEMPAKKLHYRETYSPDGKVRLLDGTDQLLAEHKLVLHPAAAPNLRPELSKLVVLPLPLRTIEHVVKQYPREAVQGNFEKLSDEAALAVFTAHYGAGRGGQILNLFGNRYHRGGDRRVGFYTLIAATPATFHPGNEYWTGAYKVRFDPAAEHPAQPVAAYLARYNLKANQWQGDFGTVGGPPESFLQHLATFHDLWFRWQQGTANKSEADRQAHWQRALAFVKSCEVPLFRWTVLDLMQRNHSGPAQARELAELYRATKGISGLAYHARYELARSLSSAGNYPEARTLFAESFTDALEAGAVPAIDQSFHQAFHNSNSRESWLGLLRKAGDRLREEDRRGDLIALAWQCHQLGDPSTANELLGRVFTGLAEELRPALTLAVIEYGLHTGQYPRADGLLQGLLEDQRFAEHPQLLRLAAQIATQRGMLARAAGYLEKALDREFRDLPALINVQVIRTEYSQLLAHYQQLALAVNMLEATPPKEFLARVIRAADRWRALDPDPTAACQAAARVLQNAGAKDLAWDYLTTPLSLKPNEAAPWLSLAQHLHGDGQYDLASRAYAAAYEAEPTNAQILWDHAQMLQQVGRVAEAGSLHQKLAEGEWQPRFQGLKQQARQLLNWR